MSIIKTVVNYNRSLLSNNAGGISPPIILPGFPGSPLVLGEFGLFIPTDNPVNFVELTATVGWQALINSITSDQTLQLLILQDGNQVGSANQEAPPDISAESPLDNTNAFQVILTNVSPGHHVYQLLGINLEPGEGAIQIFGPVNFSGRVYA